MPGIVAKREGLRLCRLAVAFGGKLQRVRLWYGQLDKKPAGEDWKRWIAKKAKVSVAWITRAINKGDLSANPFAESTMKEEVNSE
jgi:hypothetical protein